jgi:ethanolamine ammonia-lyase small subunit
MGIAPRELRALTARIAQRAAPAYLMAVAGNADPMLGYLTTSFREHPRLRVLVGREMPSEMRRRLQALGVMPGGVERADGASAVGRLYAHYRLAAGDHRSVSSLEEEGTRRLHEMRDRGLDLGMADEAASDARLDRIYANARAALYATLDDHVIARATVQPVRMRTIATSRDDYLAHPAAGERTRPDDGHTMSVRSGTRTPQVQVVVSDGLNANAVNEQLPALLPPLRKLFSDRGVHVADHDIVVTNGRVRAGYEIGGTVGAEVLIHLIGERPGTGLNTLSAYITYGRDAAGQSRWSRDLDHSATSAVCGIHPRGKPPEAAAAEIARLVSTMLERRASGVALSNRSAG